MISAAQWKAYNDAVASITVAANSTVAAKVREWLDENPGASTAEARDAAERILKSYSGVYGQQAATLAAEWYDAQGKAAGAKLDRAVTSATVDEDSLRRTVRYQARLLEDGGGDFASAVGEWAENAAKRAMNDTVLANAKRDRRKGVRFARVTSGRNTCAFCLMLAGRGAVYHTRETAGELNRYHRHCSCKIVPSYSGDQYEVLVEGHDPKDALKLWNACREIDSRGDLTEEQKAELKKALTADPLLRTRADPALDYFGPAEEDDPAALAAIKGDLRDAGVELIVSGADREAIGYGPSPAGGSPGSMHVTEGMSLSAWMHEYRHFCQDRELGFPSFSHYLENSALRASMEEEAYGVEIARAESHGYNELAEKLRELLEAERSRLDGERQDG